MEICCRNRIILLILGIIAASGGLALIIFGYINPLARYSGYSLKQCHCMSIQIYNPSNYVGVATLQYIHMIRNVTVITSSSYNAVKAYMSVNFAPGLNVQCFVSSSDIKVSTFSSPVAVVFTCILFITSAILIMLYIYIVLAENHKRKDYEDITDNKPLHEVNIL
jgi:hypothetical protein